MSAAIDDLAQLILTKRKAGSKFIIMLGAGASIAAGAPSMKTLATSVLTKYDQAGSGEPETRFSDYWDDLDPSTREDILDEFLDQSPTEGHRSLARLVEAGYFDAIVTFNYDDLLEAAMRDLNVAHRAHVRGELNDDVFAQYMGDDEQGVRVLKIHGSMRGAKIYLASREEMAKYPRVIAETFMKVSEGNLIICGYAFADACVQRAFYDGDEGGVIYCADPQGPSTELRSYAVKRLTNERVIDGREGNFDEFFPALERALKVAATGRQPDNVRPERNPFKFLEGLYGEDRELLFGRAETIEEIIGYVTSGTHRLINIQGRKKTGKSSLLRAGVMPALEEKNYDVVYLRCPSTHDRTVAGMLDANPSLEVPVRGISAAIEGLDANKSGKMVIVLDQFERAVSNQISEQGEDSLADLYDELYGAAKKLAALVLVSSSDQTHAVLMELIRRHRDYSLTESVVTVEKLKAVEVAAMLDAFNELAAGCVSEEHREDYAYRVEHEQNFTLAHLHTLCHLIVSDVMRNGHPSGDVVKKNVEDKLDIAINTCDVMNLIEDLNLKEERILLRNLMKIVSDDSKTLIATHVKDSLYNLLTQPGYTAGSNESNATPRMNRAVA